MQFHLLKLHLCTVIRKLLSRLYLVPSIVGSINLRQKWETMQSGLEDVEELRQSLPDHLQIHNLTQYNSDLVWQQQCIFLETLMQYTIILATRPLLGSKNNPNEEYDVPETIITQRRMAAHQASYRAACAICALVTEERRHILGLSVHLLFAAWGMYTSAAELIALHAIKSPSGSDEAREGYRNLAIMLHHFAEVQKLWPSSQQTYAILQDLVKVVLAKVDAESRMPSPEPPSPMSTDENTDRVVEMDMFQPETSQGNPLEGIDLQWFDDFLASQNVVVPEEVADPTMGPGDLSWLWSDISGVNFES